ncbi:MAG: sugar ABC transporter ATP-binding protein, partial [Actinobacteria bacterium]|nr:sugar ABC transporter ATP-binding protein [Actinomycetota bacterium]
HELSIEVDGVSGTASTPRAALRRGIVMLPEDRLREGLVGGLPVAANIKLGRRGLGRLRGLIGRRGEEELGRRWIERLSIRGAAPRGPWERLSGGNQQKVLFARALDRLPRLLVLDEPTRGVDVGARAELHALVRSFAAEQGGGVLVATSDLDELCDLCDRALVLREGQVVGELTGEALTRDQILRSCYEH